MKNSAVRLGPQFAKCTIRHDALTDAAIEDDLSSRRLAGRHDNLLIAGPANPGCSKCSV